MDVTSIEARLAQLGERLLAADNSVLGDILATIGDSTLASLRSAFRGALTNSDLDDVLSVALFKLWDKRSRFSLSQGRLDSWFRAIALNVARDLLRRKARERSSFEGYALQHRPAAASTHSVAVDGEVEEAVFRLGQEEQAALAVISGLSLRDKKILLSHPDVSSGESTRQLAVELGMTVDAVRQQRSRLVRRVRSEVSSILRKFVNKGGPNVS